MLERKLQKVCETRVSGAVYALNDFNGKVLAGVNSKVKPRIVLRSSLLTSCFKVQLYQKETVEGSAMELKHVCSFYGHILALYLRSQYEVAARYAGAA